MAAATASPKEIVFYTNRDCPYAQRAFIALTELGLPYREETIDLSKPRTEEYLKINPRGLVPSISYDGQIITESVIVAQFLADAFPSHLVPPSNTAEGALRRARINFFVDTFSSKVGPNIFKVFRPQSDEDKEKIVDDVIDVIAKELEPLLADAAPYFGGSDKTTLAEVLTGSFIQRLYALPHQGILPERLETELKAKTPNFAKWAQTVVNTPSVKEIFDEERFAGQLKERWAQAAKV